MSRAAHLPALILAAGLLVGASGCSRDPYPTTPTDAGTVATSDLSGVVTRYDSIFAVIDHIDGDALTLHLLHSVESGNLQTILFVGSEVRATLLPAEPGRSRRRACVTAISSQWSGNAVLVDRWSDDPRPDCLAQLGDFRGRAGLPADGITLDTVVTIKLNGDVVTDAPPHGGARSPHPLDSPAQGTTTPWETHHAQELPQR